MNQALSPTDKQLASKKFPPDQNMLVAVERNWWRLTTLVTLIILAVMSFALMSANEKAGSRDVVWIKMFPDGTWSLGSAEEHAQRDYFQSTADSLLTEYAKLRYQVVPETVRADYGKALLFMSDTLKGQFTSSSGFDAAAKAAEFASRPNTSRVTIDVGVVDHYERVTGQLRPGVKSPIYRTNVHLERVTLSPEGLPRGEPEKLILSLRWTVLEEAAVERKSVNYLRANPIGLVVLEQSLFEDVK